MSECIVTERQCCRADKCSAPICPLLPETWKRSIWFPDEEVCGLLKFRKELCVKKQRAIARKTKDRDSYFTHAMLNYDYMVKKGIKGLDRDLSPEDSARKEKEWIKKHPAMSAAFKQAFLDRIHKAQEDLPGFDDDEPL